MSWRVAANGLVLVIIGAPIAVLLISGLLVGFADQGLIVAGAVFAVPLLGLAVYWRRRRSRTTAVAAAMGAAAIIVAFAGTYVGGGVCADRDGVCQSGPPSETRYDSDWHGWPIPWKTDMSKAHQRENDWDETLIFVDSHGTSLPPVIMSLAYWFVVGAGLEAFVVAGWLLLASRWHQLASV